MTLKEQFEYQKTVSLEAITLEQRNMNDEIIGKSVLDEGCLYKIELVDKFTLIHEIKK